MKYLSDYTQAKQTKLFDELGIFFAFGKDQFDKQKQDWVKYVSFDSGMLCPKANVDTFLKKHKKIIANAIKTDIKENWAEAIIRRELANHECYYTWRIEDAVAALKDYWYDYDKILKVYKNKIETNQE